jgi:hypothetical protein
MTQEDWHDLVLAKLKKTIISFGEYNFFDKPDEIIHFEKEVKELSELSPEVAGGCLQHLYNSSPNSEVIDNAHCSFLARFMAESLEDSEPNWFNEFCNAFPSFNQSFEE